MENAVKFLVKFCFSSFPRKRSSKVPRIFHDKFHAIFHQTFCSCKCPISWRFSLCRRSSLIQLVEKVRQYPSNLYGSTPPICIAVLSWLLSFEERETLQYASHLYCSTPPICTAVRPPFVRQYFWKNTGGWGHRNVSEKGEP